MYKRFCWNSQCLAREKEEQVAKIIIRQLLARYLLKSIFPSIPRRGCLKMMFCASILRQPFPKILKKIGLGV